MVSPRQNASQHAGEELSCLGENIEVNSCGDSHGFKHVHQVIGGGISGGPGRIGTSPDSCGRAIKAADSRLVSGQGIGQGGASGVMQVQRQSIGRNAPQQQNQQQLDTLLRFSSFWEFII